MVMPEPRPYALRRPKIKKTAAKPPRPSSSSPRINGLGLFRIGLVALGLVVAIIVGYSIANPRESHGWEDYPGTAFRDSDDILAADSLQTMRADGTALLTDLQTELQSYGFEWTLESVGRTAPAGNGYHGRSMLKDYLGDVFVGQVTSSDPEARAAIVHSFTTVISSNSAGRTSMVNDAMDAASSELMFGATEKQYQALWSVRNTDYDSWGLEAELDVFDATVPTSDKFSVPAWVPDEASSTLFVRITVSARYQLSERDRVAFMEALEPYDGRTKPPYYD